MQGYQRVRCGSPGGVALQEKGSGHRARICIIKKIVGEILRSKGQTGMKGFLAHAERILASMVMAGVVAGIVAGAALAAGAQQQQPAAQPSSSQGTGQTADPPADQPTDPATEQGIDRAANLPSGLNPIPAAPKGTSTIFGGEIKNIDPVRDVLTLGVYGQRPMKILFDERTQVYLDGKRIPLRALAREDHASVETTLDGTAIFAVSIHELSHAPEGQYSGKVIGFDAGSRELTLAANGSRDPLKVRVAQDASIVREGQSAFTATRSGLWDLRNGSLIALEFSSDNEGHGLTNKITVYAVPGAAFAFSGNITFLNEGLGRLVLVDPRDQKSYEISFDSARTPAGRDLHLGESVSVRAEYDGNRYMASTITPD